jgi:hypothetical protein
MRMTLIDMVQDILSSMDSDEVDSIDDTTEAMQVARVIRSTYYDIITRLDAPEHYDYYNLLPTTSATPTIMTLPSNALTLESIKYNIIETSLGDTLPNLVDVDMQEKDTFFNQMYLLMSQDNTINFTHDSKNFYCYTDRAPSKYTSYDDYTIVFDAYNSAEDTNLQSSKTMAYGMLGPTFSFDDAFIPDLDARQFPLLLNESKVLAHAEQKQTQHPVAAQRARKAWIKSQSTKQGIKTHTALERAPDYGKK